MPAHFELHFQIQYMHMYWFANSLQEHLIIKNKKTNRLLKIQGHINLPTWDALILTFIFKLYVCIVIC